MLLSRLLTYGILGLVAVLVLVDTNIGAPLNSHDRIVLQDAILYLTARGFADDARLGELILDADDFRRSRFYSNLSALDDSGGHGFSFYAYTPVLSKSRVFIGENYWHTGIRGHASVLLHELVHVQDHRHYALIGLRRSEDETAAYRRQYDMYKKIGLTPSGADGLVYWDMMIGVVTYVVPRYPAYAKHADVRAAQRLFAQTAPEPGPDYMLVPLFIILALVILVIGDKLGLRLACAIRKRCPPTPLLHLDPWLLPLFILLPSFILAAYVLVFMIGKGSSSAVEFLASNLAEIVLVLFGASGIIGGFFGHTADADRPPREPRGPT